MVWETVGLGATATAGLWFSSRFAWWRPTVSVRFPRVLMYHMIQAPRSRAGFNGLRVSPEMFEQQLAWLRSDNWTFRFVSELSDNWESLPDRCVALTFDDGYRDNFTAALPLLEKYNARATLYLVWDRSGLDWSRNKKAHHDSGELRDEPKLSDIQVEQMLASGRIELGGHTITHLNMARADRETKRQELVEGRQLLEDRFGVAVRSFAYPFGLYATGDTGLVREAGYSNAVTTHPGIDSTTQPDRFQLRRVKISGRESMRGFRLRMRTGWRAWNK